MLQDEIIRVVRVQQRNLRRGVLPRHVQAWSRVPAAEFTYRRYMVQMWEAGKLIRIGGEGSRRGYRLPTPAEAKCAALPALLSQTGAMSVREVALMLGTSAAAVQAYIAQMPQTCGVLLDGECVRRATSLEQMALELAGMYPWDVHVA